MNTPISPKTWRENWLEFRNKLLASPRFQRWAIGFPLTRPIARKNTRALFDLVAGFVYSQILAACVRLDLFEILGSGAQTVSGLAERMGLGDEAAERLLKGAAALNLTERLPDGRFALGFLGAALRGNPSVAAMIAHHAMLYEDLADPVTLLRRETRDRRLADFWVYAGNDNPSAVASEQARDYSRLMASSQTLIAGDVLAAYPLRRHKCLLDVGGGEGVFLAEAGKRAPKLQLMLFDLPAVVTKARMRLEQAGLASRSQVFAGSFFTDPLPQGADVISLIRVLHDHDDEAALALLRNVRAALQHGGKLLIAEPMAQTKDAEPAGDAYFGFYLWAMGSGRPRTSKELEKLAISAGFRRTMLLATRNPLLVRVMVAET